MSSRFICKRCGAESPAGIGYANHGSGPLPAPDPACPNPHMRPVWETRRIGFKTWLWDSSRCSLLAKRPHPQTGDGMVRINFGTESPLIPAVLAFELTPDEAREFARQLIHVAGASEDRSVIV